MTSKSSQKVALVTGSSRGIGKAIALELAGKKMSIVVNYLRNEEAAQETVTTIKKMGHQAVPFQANVKNPEEIKALIEFTEKQFGRLDVLVHNAAMGAFKPVSDLKKNQWELSLDINAHAFLLLAQAALPLLEASGNGHLIAISSLGSKRFIPKYGAIGISKAALEALVKYLAVELASKKIRVNAVSGGPVETDALKLHPDFETSKPEAIAKTPGGRLGTPEDLANVVGFLVSEKARWVYGQTIIVDGGLSLA